MSFSSFYYNFFIILWAPNKFWSIEINQAELICIRLKVEVELNTIGILRYLLANKLNKLCRVILVSIFFLGNGSATHDHNTIFF